MSLVPHLYAQLQAYLDGKISLWDVQDWLASGIEHVMAPEDPELQSVAGKAWLLIAEWQGGLRTEDRVRENLRELVSVQPTITTAVWTDETLPSGQGEPLIPELSSAIWGSDRSEPNRNESNAQYSKLRYEMESRTPTNVMQSGAHI